MSVIVVCRYSSVWSLNHVQVQTGLLKTWMRSFHFCMLTYRNLNYGRQVFAKPLKSVFFLFCVDAEINIWWKTIVYLCCSHFPVSVADESVFIRFISLGFRVFLFFFFCKEKKYSAHRIHNYKIPSLCCMDLKVRGEWCREFVYLHWSIRCCVV